MKQQCNSTHDQLCECAPGFHLVIEFCIAHKACSPGYGVAALGKSNTLRIIFRLSSFYRNCLKNENSWFGQHKML